MIRLERYEEAIETLDRALEINSQHLDAWYNKGLAVSLLGECEKSLEALDKALEINPNFENAMKTRKGVLETLNQTSG